MRIDLHVHTTASDGTFAPSEAVALAREKGLDAIAITDHDTMDGWLALPEASRSFALPGIELSSRWLGRDIHVLGYFTDPGRLRTAERARVDRMHRNGEMIRRLQADGVDISLDELHRRGGGGSIGRPHIAALLVEKGYFSTVNEAFARWLGEGRRYYVPRADFSPWQAAEEIRAAGGKAVLAHPLQYRLEEEALTELVRRCAEEGFCALEALYTGYGSRNTALLSALARRFGLGVTGGSDFHGSTRPNNILGEPEVPGELLEALKHGN